MHTHACTHTHTCTHTHIHPHTHTYTHTHTFREDPPCSAFSSLCDGVEFVLLTTALARAKASEEGKITSPLYQQPALHTFWSECSVRDFVSLSNGYLSNSNTHTCTYTHALIHVYTYMHMCTHTHTHITHTNTHTHTHTQNADQYRIHHKQQINHWLSLMGDQVTTGEGQAECLIIYCITAEVRAKRHRTLSVTTVEDRIRSDFKGKADE